jgi:hypothetical protein
MLMFHQTMTNRTIKTMAIKSAFRKHFIFKPTEFLQVIVVLLLSPSVFGQLQVVPIPREKTEQTLGRQFLSARTQATGPLSIPFFDDFTKTTKRYFPDTAKWQHSYTPWVNDGLAINAPTINVVTFDGLDSAGLAYSASDILASGFTDSLISKPINLSATGTNPVLESERLGVYFSFYYQWKGNGEAPDPEDYLLLEFRNVSNKWVPVLTIKTLSTFTANQFYSSIIQVTGDEFFHSGFQFRFRSFGRQSGPYDNWNLDYVYLNKGRNSADLSFPDRAAASSISPLFKPFTSIPYTHFLATRKLDSVRWDVQNLKNFPASVNYKAQAKYTNYINNTPLYFSKTLISSGGVKGGAGDMQPYERVKVKLSNLLDVNNPSEFNPSAQAVDIQLKMKVISNDSTDADRFKFEPVNLQVNDTVSATFKLRDYYAYDDGNAEYAAGLIETGNLLAYEFEPLFNETLKQDTLIGFDIYFPSYGVTSNQTVDFFIYSDNNGEPAENPFRIPSKAIERKKTNEFQRITFLPALLMTQKKFYIGWKQPVAGSMLVGLDINNDTGNKMWVNTNGFWYKNDRVFGSLMIRPIFGHGLVETQVGIEEPSLTEFSIYPNPTRGAFTIQGEFDSIQIVSSVGQMIPFSIEKREESTMIQFDKHQPGLYIVKIANRGSVTSHKLIVRD